jgi:hypothetical protein
VVTKLDDQMEGEHCAKRMIMNQEIPLRLGYVGVVNRSEEDIDNRMTLAESRDRERVYFNTHPVY